jgi:arsenite-transporting ATPase
VNQSLTPVATHDPVLAARRRAERPFLDEVRELSRKWAVVPWVAEAPRGAKRLARLSE